MTQSIGPPSLAQGTRIAVGFSTSISRFIPACGELSKPSWAIVQLDGLSPLARGTQDLDRLGYVADRFIPAYAGNSWRLRYSCGLVPVHPRLRGELKSIEGIDICWCGSSPLTRGTQSKALPRTVPRRFIPAYAGNSFSLSHHPIHYSVHPRLRGELSITATAAIGAGGSSPLTRGTHTSRARSTSDSRFIPAYAGNSARRASWSSRLPVHPRLRGELLTTTRSVLSLKRFIPAYAGNSEQIS